MPEKQAKNMEKMIKLQWALISVLAMSGVAGAPELLQAPDDTDETGTQKVQARLEDPAAIVTAEDREEFWTRAPLAVPKLPERLEKGAFLTPRRTWSIGRPDERLFGSPPLSHRASNLLKDWGRRNWGLQSRGHRSWGRGRPSWIWIPIFRR